MSSAAQNAHYEPISRQLPSSIQSSHLYFLSKTLVGVQRNDKSIGDKLRNQSRSKMQGVCPAPARTRLRSYPVGGGPPTLPARRKNLLCHRSYKGFRS